MTLDEAIEHAKEVARTCDDSGCAADHIQLAEWLRQARGAGKAARWYTSRIHELEADNAKLRGLALILLNCAGSVDRCDNCMLNGNPYDVVVRDWFACDTLYDMVKEMGLL